MVNTVDRAYFLEEFDNSQIQTPTVDGIVNLVLGFSKKGTVNSPVLLNTLSDLENVYGTIDRSMEKKGSYFHRTIAKMLESSPVYAINLLNTDDNLDKAQYRSFSTATGYFNDAKRTDAYSRFFDTSSFWKRDKQSFLNVVNDDPNAFQRVLNLVNMSDKDVTVFIYKSRRSGFDVDLVTWYGNKDLVPAYLYETDYVSDYLVDVIILAGDWTNYQSLAVDPRWQTYFNATGLIKSQVDAIVSDQNITVLGFYQGLSLIPFFLDRNGRNIFIETVMNRDTDTTGIFVAFNDELLENVDYPTGLLDIIGNSLVASTNVQEIDFLSYKDTISEVLNFDQVFLDRTGNVISLGTGPTSYAPYFASANNLDPQYRTIHFAEEFIGRLNNPFNGGNGIISTTPQAFTGVPTSSAPTVSVFTFSVTDDAYGVFGTQLVEITSSLGQSGVNFDEVFSIVADDYAAQPIGTASSIPSFYSSAFVLNSRGNIVKVDNLLNANLPQVSPSDIVLGYVEFGVSNAYTQSLTNSTIYPKYITDLTYTPVTIDNNGYVYLQFGVDYQVTSLGNNKYRYEFLNTAAVPSTSIYEQYRRIKKFNSFVNAFSSANNARVVLLDDVGNKIPFNSFAIESIETSTALNKSFVLDMKSNTNITGITTGNLHLYVNDNEFLIGVGGNPNLQAIKTKNTLATNDEGVVARYSDFYERYNNGSISTGDYFHENILREASTDEAVVANITFLEDNSGNNYVVIYDVVNKVTGLNTNFEIFNVNDKLVFPDAVSNTGVFTITDTTNYAQAVFGLPNATNYAFLVAEDVVADEIIVGTSKVFDFLNKHFLKMYFDSNGDLNVSYTADDLTSPNPILYPLVNVEIDIFSQKTNYRQSVEIETPTGYTPSPNKILIDATRYTEVRVGDFLEAFVDTSALEPNEVPKRLTRILSKRQYAPIPTLTEITCDARINVREFNGDKQTYRFSSVEDYVTTYKGTVFAGFKVRAASMPDGTEARQDEILNVVEKNSPLFNAICNKEAFTFRYLVDSFGLGLTEQSKQQLVDICGERLDCFGFLNMPSIRSFRNSTSPTFTNPNGSINVEFISKGGDPESSPAFLYSFGTGRGQSCVGYFLPYVVVNDNGRPLDFPPAAYVATTYMRKFTSQISTIRPWTIAAGTTNGLITAIADLEYNFTPQDQVFLNRAQMNYITRRRNGNFVIETENTAQVLTRSALNKIHTREVLIELETELNEMLAQFQFRFNTPAVRAEVKLRADIICEKYRAQEGLFDFFNKCDDENNTPEVIDNDTLVLDCYVEIVRGIEVIVNQVTVLRTGAIASGGFITA